MCSKFKLILTNTLVLFFLIIFYACDTNQEKNTDIYIDEIIDNSTAYQYPDIELGKYFYIDTISVSDSTSTYTVYCLQSNQPKLSLFNKQIKTTFKNQIDLEILNRNSFYLSERPASEFYYLAAPILFFRNNKIISITYIIDTYTEGGNHHNYINYSFNYNLTSKSKIDFEDVFNVENKKDTIAFIAFCEDNVINGGCTNWGDSYHYFDFYFNEKGLAINPNLGWACTSTQSLISYNNKSKFINDEWFLYYKPMP